MKSIIQENQQLLDACGPSMTGTPARLVKNLNATNLRLAEAIALAREALELAKGLSGEDTETGKFLEEKLDHLYRSSSIL